jgi:hypothetical protein
MTKKPAAALSANLVAVKGTATPAPDMPSRAAPMAAATPTVVPMPSKPAAEPVEAGEGGGQPLNFRVPQAFRREFKVFAASHGLKLNELLRLSFEAYRDRRGS